MKYDAGCLIRNQKFSYRIDSILSSIAKDYSVVVWKTKRIKCFFLNIIYFLNYINSAIKENEWNCLNEPLKYLVNFICFVKFMSNEIVEMATNRIDCCTYCIATIDVFGSVQFSASRFTRQTKKKNGMMKNPSTQCPTQKHWKQSEASQLIWLMWLY